MVYKARSRPARHTPQEGITRQGADRVLIQCIVAVCRAWSAFPVVMSLKLAACLLLVLGNIGVGQAAGKLLFKRVDAYDWIYDDRGTGANSDVSIWRPKDYENGYFPLGDSTVASHSAPRAIAIMVKDDGNVAKPTGFQEIWNDRGSGGTYDVRVMQMTAPSGYTCLGHVAILGYGSQPDANKYRCIPSSMLISGAFEKIWDDSGSGASRDVSFYGNRQSPNIADGIDANTFTSVARHSAPSGSPKLLGGAYVTDRAGVNAKVENVAITVYQTSELREIWNDRGSGANSDLSTWRSQGPSDTYSLGDIAVNGYSKPRAGFVVKAVKSDALKPATSWRQVWNDAGSGARWDGAFWKPSCPYMYRPLGYVSMRNHGQTPPADAFRCVKAEYTVQGRWNLVWRDHGSGARYDVGIWKADPSGSGQGLSAMMAVRNHGSMDRTAFVLDPSVVNYVVGKPATKYTLQNVQYNFDDRSIGFSEPDTLVRTIIENRGTTKQTMTRAVSYSYTETYSWGSSLGLEVGVTTEVSAGIPEVASASVSVSTTVSMSQTWGGSTSETKTDSASVAIEVAPKSQKTAIVTGRRYEMDIPYTATLITTYSDGTTGVNNRFSGVFKGVQVNEIRVIYEADVPLGN